MLTYRNSVVSNVDDRDCPAQPYILFLQISKIAQLVYTTATLINTERVWTCIGLHMLKRRLHCALREVETIENDDMSPRHLHIH